MESLNNDLECLTEDQERMRRDLRYHFMNPKEKWQAKGTLPIKMILIIIKIIMIITQLVIFSENNVNEVSFFEGSKTTFKNLFLRKWDSSQETPSYPPSHGEFAVYTIDCFYKSLSYALNEYSNMEHEAIGPYGYGLNNSPYATLCVKSYIVSKISPWNSTYNFSNYIEEKCTEMMSLGNSSVKHYLESKNASIDFNGLVTANLHMNLRSIQLKSFELDQIPNCYEFNISILYDNSNHNGQVIVDLHTTVRDLSCTSSVLSSKPTDTLIKDMVITLDVICLFFSTMSLILSIRSLWRLYKFWKRSKKFFLNEMGTDIQQKWSYFFGISYMIILIGDLCNITGTFLKLQIYTSGHAKLNNGLTDLTVCSYFLGLGLFLGFCTILRYFSYFPKSSILVNTIRVGIPPLLRFSVCSVILYLAFALFGWIILGPYHIKFRTLTSSIACLFSLMNGDDMYVTLTIINKENYTVYMFSQLYIYLFCLLFVFVVLNLILTIIIESYDQVKNGSSQPKSRNDIFWNFIKSCPETATSQLYRTDRQWVRSQSQQKNNMFVSKCIDALCCCIGKGSHTHELRNSSSSHGDDNCGDNENKELTCSFYNSNGANSEEGSSSTQLDHNGSQCNLIDANKRRSVTQCYGSTMRRPRSLQQEFCSVMDRGHSHHHHQNPSANRFAPIDDSIFEQTNRSRSRSRNQSPDCVRVEVRRSRTGTL